MIKLNNKNITYVALADSNISLKAPKEIWYADSSNSVKLVYRRKDALIEGEDYEKYHWLKGRNGAFINTLHKLAPCDDVFECHFKWDGETANPNGKTQGVFGCYFYQDANCWTRVAIAYNLFYVNYFKLVNWNTIPINGVNDVEIKSLMSSSDSGNYSFTLNGVTHEYSNNGLANTETNADVLLFENIAKNDTYFHGDIAYFKITDTSSNTKMSLIPCKLLKPVPKWLDANGIRRQVGECGMIDLISGKFYGNVNSVGTFTVENYYERKEWLVGDGSAYIVNKYNLWNNNVETRSAKINLQKIENNDLVYTEANGLNWAIQQNPTLVPQLMANFREEGVGFHILELNTTPETFELKFYKKNGYAVCLFDGIEHQGGTMTESKWNKDISPRIYSYKMSYIREVLPDGSYRSNLIPCTLTMDLPASMDANNIARTKCTSGMWDLVSDKFYGNVASNGTFKAVNLAEGVDYEVHQWLVGDRVAYIEGVNYNLWDNTISLQIGKTNVRGNGYLNYNMFSITEDMAVSPSSLMVVFRQNNDTKPHIADIAPYSSMPDVVTMDFYIENSLFYCNQNGVVKANVPSQTAIESTWKSVTPQIYSAKMSYIREVLPNGSYNSNLIPVKLLHSIPSKYDANGIARQAGECGMYDTVNDVFYGNVASSGTFSVSDDE